MTVTYKGITLSKGSYALELYEKKQMKLLDQHMKELDEKEKNLAKRYSASVDQPTPITDSQWLKERLTRP